MWKVYQISNGVRVRGGFASENAAKDWVERKGELLDDDFDVEEMDEEEEEEFLESGDDDEDSLLGEAPFAAIGEFADADGDVEQDDIQARAGGSNFDETEDLEEGGFTVSDEEDV